MRMVLANRRGDQHVRGHGDGRGQARPRFVVGVLGGNLVVARIAYSGGRLCIGTGAAVSRGRLAQQTLAVCGRGTDGADGLSDAVAGVYAVLLSLHHRSVWTRGTSLGIAGDGGPVHVAGGVQQLVARNVPVWTDGVAVEGIDVREVSGDAQGAELSKTTELRDWSPTCPRVLWREGTSAGKWESGNSRQALLVRL